MVTPRRSKAPRRNLFFADTGGMAVQKNRSLSTLARVVGMAKGA
jgi:hypothetical protein